MFCSDNYIIQGDLFSQVYKILSRIDLTGAYSRHYAVIKGDNSLNRYFSYIGNNDPICFYLGKCDRKPWYDLTEDNVTADIVVWPYCNSRIPSLGDNGFFVKRHILMKYADLDHYYPMDVYKDINKTKTLSFLRIGFPYVWHRTSENLISFLRKRYFYARDLYCDRNDRRWKIIDDRKDRWKLALFVLASLTIVQPFFISLKGFRKFRDLAWFWHPIVCVGFLITYGILSLRNFFKYGNLWQKQASLSRPSAEVQA